jgi:hypothetical protein
MKAQTQNILMGKEKVKNIKAVASNCLVQLSERVWTPHHQKQSLGMVITNRLLLPSSCPSKLVAMANHLPQMPSGVCLMSICFFVRMKGSVIEVQYRNVDEAGRM